MLSSYSSVSSCYMGHFAPEHEAGREGHLAQGSHVVAPMMHQIATTTKDPLATLVPRNDQFYRLWQTTAKIVCWTASRVFGLLCK